MSRMRVILQRSGPRFAALDGEGLGGGQDVNANAGRKNRLGMGLAALIGDQGGASAAAEEGGSQTLRLDAIRPSPFNPRRSFPKDQLDELAASIRERGLVQPLLVRPVEGGKGRYEIVAGERRWRAAQLVGLEELPVIIRILTDSQALELAIIENVQRTDLNAVEEAHGYRDLLDNHQYTHDNLAQTIGKSRSHVTNTLRLLQLPDDVLDLVREGVLSAGHARALIGQDDALAVARRIVAEGLSVRAVEALMQEPKPRKEPSTRQAKPADTRAVEEELSSALGLGVALHQGRGEKGELRIRYTTLEQFEDIRARLMQAAQRRAL